MSQKHEQMIDWKNIWTYDVLAAEYQFVGFENSVRNKTYCKDIAVYMHPYISWLVLWFTQQVNLSIKHIFKKNRKHMQLFNSYMNVFVVGS